MHLDRQIGIDTDTMKAITVHDISEKWRQVSIKGYKHSLDATLNYLQDLGYISVAECGLIEVTYSGWHVFSATVMEVMRGLILNVLIPITVSVIAAVATTILMQTP